MKWFKAFAGSKSKDKSGKDKARRRFAKAKPEVDDELTISKLSFEDTPRSINLRHKIADLCEGESTYDIAAALSITTVKLLMLVKPKDRNEIFQIFIRTVTTGIQDKASRRKVKKK